MALAVRALLKRMGLPGAYFDAFEEEGFDSVDRVALMDEEDVDAVLDTAVAAAGSETGDSARQREQHKKLLLRYIDKMKDTDRTWMVELAAADAAAEAASTGEGGAGNAGDSVAASEQPTDLFSALASVAGHRLFAAANIDGSGAGTGDGDDSLGSDGVRGWQGGRRLRSFDVGGIARRISKGRACKILVLAGEELAAAAGVPDYHACFQQQRHSSAPAADGVDAGSGGVDVSRVAATQQLEEALRAAGLAPPAKHGEPMASAGSQGGGLRDLFDLDCFRSDPRPLLLLGRELLFEEQQRSPSPHDTAGHGRRCHHRRRRRSPSKAHFLLRLLHERGLLLRVYTQNIDGLEEAAGVPAHKVVPLLGSFVRGGSCCRCGARVGGAAMVEALRSFASEDAGNEEDEETGECTSARSAAAAPPPPPVASSSSSSPTAPAVSLPCCGTTGCSGRLRSHGEPGAAGHLVGRVLDASTPLVRPDVIFHHEHDVSAAAAAAEPLPPPPCSSRASLSADLRAADLLIVLGNALSVSPFAGLLGAVSPYCPRLLLHPTAVGVRPRGVPDRVARTLGLGGGFRFEEPGASACPPVLPSDPLLPVARTCYLRALLLPCSSCFHR